MDGMWESCWKLLRDELMLKHRLKIGVMPKWVPLQKDDKDSEIDNVLHIEDPYAQCRLEVPQSEHHLKPELKKMAAEPEAQCQWRQESPEPQNQLSPRHIVNWSHK